MLIIHFKARKKCLKFIESWEFNWIGKTQDTTMDDLNVEHGSVFELSEAIATPIEKFANALPSMLLIIGLLGTFLGIGLSLNEAAGILNSPALSLQPNADMIGQMKPILAGMTEMLDKMGALFKSSIYGIIFFFLFSAWHSKFGTDGKRLKFCIEKCNALLAKKKMDETEPIIGALNNVSKSLGNDLKEVLINVLNEGMRHINDSLLTINKSLGESMKETISKGFESAKRSLKAVADDTAETADALKELNQTMISSFNSVADSAKEMSEASSSLKKSVENFTPAVQTTLDNIQTKFVNSINASGQIMERAGVDIRNAVEKMSKKTEDGQNSLNSTLSTFRTELGDIMMDISRMTKDIGRQAKTSKDEMAKIREEICDRLVSIASSNIMLKDVIDQIPLNKINEYIDVSLKNAMQSTDSRNKSTQSIALGHEKAGK
ncbi:hypothetical protein SAMN05720762_11250 [Fibrobacter sp. UWH4]|nr:hypothetical protein SAMN05720762_11250 [Fibrobacter sp. UWH4]